MKLQVLGRQSYPDIPGAEFCSRLELEAENPDDVAALTVLFQHLAIDSGPLRAWLRFNPACGDTDSERTAREVVGCEDLRDVMLHLHDPERGFANGQDGHSRDVKTCSRAVCTRGRATLARWGVEL
jgi:hypothetical protein